MIALVWITAALAASPAPTPLVAVPGGVYKPLYPVDPAQPETAVPAFRLEAHPVTVGQFRAFVAQHPQWRPGAPPALFAGPGYLQSWTGAQPPADDRPVTEVSWYAARAYCQSQGRRLPTEDEWELVARASTTAKDASDDAVWLASVLAWYGEPSGKPLLPVMQGPPNAWGVHDTTGLVWEWVDDFNNQLVASDAREAGEDDKARFCGVGAVSAQDVRDYANFMRVAWRSALTGSTTTRNLGFRCAAEAEAP